MDEAFNLSNIELAVQIGIISKSEGFAAYKAVKEGDYELIKRLYKKRTDQDGHGTAERPKKKGRAIS